MPNLRDSAIKLDPAKYQPVPTMVPPAPVIPAHLQQSSVMISSLPSISTSVDGIIRQFYGGARVPTRRLILPK